MIRLHVEMTLSDDREISDLVEVTTEGANITKVELDGENITELINPMILWYYLDEYNAGGHTCGHDEYLEQNGL